MTCDAQIPAKVLPPKDPTAALWCGVDFELACARVWQAFDDVTSGDRFRAYPEKGEAGGFDFVAGNSGRTGGKEPKWPGTLNATVASGSVTFTAVALTSGSLHTSITGTPTWTPDTGITVASETIDGLRAVAKISGGTDGTDYSIAVTATLANGETVTQVIIVPVRRAVKVCEDG